LSDTHIVPEVFTYPRRTQRPGSLHLAPPLPLPRRTTSLVGRASDLERISRLVLSRRLVTLTGAGGCGKTRLALEIAHHLASDFPDGVYFVDLATIDDETMVVDLVASTLRLAPAVVGSALEATVDHLRRRRTLLILDNCEHVLSGAAAFVEHLAEAEARCAVVLTSREAVSFPGEVIWTLGPLPVDPPPAGGPAPAVELFLARLAEAVPELAIDEHTRAEAERLCAAIDGLPLAIELAAARVRTDGLAAVVAQAQTDPARLRRLTSTQRTHHDSVGDAIEWSYRTLTAGEQILHRRLAALPGPFTAEAAAAVAVTSGLSAPAVEAEAVGDLLSLLCHRSLLVPVPPSTSPGRARFRQLATVRSHARRAMRMEGELEAAEKARDAWVAALVTRRPRVFDPDPDGWYDAIDDDFDAVRSTLHRQLVEKPSPAGASLVIGLGGYWYLRRRLVEGLTWLELAEQVDALSSADAASLHCALAVRYVLQGRSDLATAHIEMARAGLARSMDVDLAWALAGLAYALLTGSESGLVATVTGDIVEVASALGDPALAVVAEALVASAVSGPNAEGVRHVYDRAIRAGNTFAASICASYLSLYALATKDPETGEMWVGRGRDLHATVGGLAFSGFDENAADFAAMAGDYRRAAALYGRSSAAAFRDGTVWPRQPATRELLRRTEEALSRGEFRRAWREGEGLGSE